MITTQQRLQLIELYVGYFNRAPLSISSTRRACNSTPSTQRAAGQLHPRPLPKRSGLARSPPVRPRSIGSASWKN